MKENEIWVRALLVRVRTQSTLTRHHHFLARNKITRFRIISCQHWIYFDRRVSLVRRPTEGDFNESSRCFEMSETYGKPITFKDW